MNPTHHAHPCCPHTRHNGNDIGCVCCRPETDPAAWAVGELVVSVIVAIGAVAGWVARRPRLVLGIAGTALVTAAVASAIDGGTPTTGDALGHVAAAGAAWLIGRAWTRTRAAMPHPHALPKGPVRRPPGTGHVVAVARPPRALLAATAALVAVAVAVVAVAVAL